MCVVFENNATFGYLNKSAHRQCGNCNSMCRIGQIIEFCVALKWESILSCFSEAFKSKTVQNIETRDTQSFSMQLFVTKFAISIFKTIST